MVPLVKAVQEQQALITAQDKKIAEQQNIIAEQNRKIDNLLRRMDKIENK